MEGIQMKERRTSIPIPVDSLMKGSGLEGKMIDQVKELLVACRLEV
jgi:hypothetical protein